MKPQHQIINEKTFEKARKKIREAKKANIKTILSTQDDELNRKILEKEPTDIFLPILEERKDWQKQKNSGLDNVMAKIAKKNKTKIAINIKEIKSKNGKSKAKILSRVIQNITICKRNKLKMAFLNYHNQEDTKALGLSLGMSTDMIFFFK